MDLLRQLVDRPGELSVLHEQAIDVSIVVVRVLPDHDAALTHLLRQLGCEVFSQRSRHKSPAH